MHFPPGRPLFRPAARAKEAICFVIFEAMEALSSAAETASAINFAADNDPSDHNQPQIVDAVVKSSDIPAAAEDGSKKRKRGAAKIEFELGILCEREKKKRASINALMAAGSSSARVQKQLEKARADLAVLSNTIALQGQKLAEERAREELKAKAAAEKAKAAAALREAESPMSEAGSLVLVELVMMAQGRLCNTSDKVDDVWTHIHTSFLKEVENKSLPLSDARSKEALRSRCAFRSYVRCACIMRAHTRLVRA